VEQLSGAPRRVASIIVGVLMGPGAGHMVKGRVARGYLWLAVTYAVFALGALLSPWLMLAALIPWVAALVDVAVVRPPPKGLPRAGIVVALLVAFLAVGQGLGWTVRGLVVEAFRIPAGSMIPTLQVGDHIMVTKLGGPVRRGDVVVFVYPADESKDFVKRVVAVGGDTVSFSAGDLVLNGKAVARKLSAPCSFGDMDERGKVEVRPCVAFEETLDGKRYRVIREPTLMDPSEGQVFVMGDNRDNSHDSRYWGTVALGKIKGKATFIWWSSGPEGIRWDRMGMAVR
jgi:signal peptidase I